MDGRTIKSDLHGWDEANTNLLTELGPHDPVTGYTELKSLLCRVDKKSKRNMEGASKSGV